MPLMPRQRATFMSLARTAQNDIHRQTALGGRFQLQDEMHLNAHSSLQMGCDCVHVLGLIKVLVSGFCANLAVLRDIRCQAAMLCTNDLYNLVSVNQTKVLQAWRNR